jgi:hypothetical protein
MSRTVVGFHKVMRVTVMKKMRSLDLLVFAFIVLSSGCAAESKRILGTGTAPTKGQISKQELQGQLDDFADYFKVSVKTVAEDIDQKSSSKKDHMMSLQMRSKLLEGFYAVSQQDDAVVSFIDTWGLCTRLRIFFEDGDGSKLYGVNQAIAIDAAKLIESRAEDIGRLFLSESAFQITQRNIREFARANPIKADFSNVVVYAAHVKIGSQNPFTKIINIPMAPFRGMEGVEHTAAAIGRFTDTADHFSDVVADLPESSRWQLLLFLYELEETEMAKSLVSSTATLSDSSVRLADLSEKFPHRLREELSALLDEIDRKQTNLQSTLVQADKTAVNVRIALEQVKEGANSVDKTVKSIKETAVTWQGAAGATGDAVKEIAKLIPSQGSASSLSAKDIQEITGNITQTAQEVRAAAADLRQLSGLMVWRIVEVITAILAAALIYRMAVIKMVKASDKKKIDS